MSLNYEKRGAKSPKQRNFSPQMALVPLNTDCGLFQSESKGSIDRPLGNLNSLPLEVLHLTFCHLSIRDLSVFSIASKIARKAVEDFCLTPKNGLRNIVPKQFLCGAFIDSKKPSVNSEELRVYDIFRSFGLLLKRTTCLYPTEKRLEIVFDFVKKMFGSVPSVNDINKLGTGIRFPLKCIGQLLHTVIAGWDEDECETVFSRLEELFGISSVVKKCLRENAGHFKLEEYFIRCYYRLVCLEVCTPLNEKAFWLSLILRQHSINDFHWTESRAKMLILIYGPLIGHDPEDIPRIAWWNLTDSLFIENGLRDISYAVHLLSIHLHNQTEWKEDVIVAVINKVVSIPDRWLFENIATFLFHSGSEVVKLVLKYLFSHGQLPEVANYIVYLTLISQKFQHNVDWIIELIDTCVESSTCNNKNRSFITEIPIAFNEALSDIEHEVDIDDERDVGELHDMMNAQNALLKALLQRVYPFFNNEKCLSTPDE